MRENTANLFSILLPAESWRGEPSHLFFVVQCYVERFMFPRAIDSLTTFIFQPIMQLIGACPSFLFFSLFTMKVYGMNRVHGFTLFECFLVHLFINLFYFKSLDI